MPHHAEKAEDLEPEGYDKPERKSPEGLKTKKANPQPAELVWQDSMEAPTE